MKTKKILSIVLSAIIMMGIFTSCKSEDNKTEAQFECGKKTYDSLNVASDICIELVTKTYNAWKFAIYDGDEGSVSDFADEVNLSEDELRQAFESFSGVPGSLLFLYLDDISATTWTVIEAYKLNGKIGEMDDAIATAKAELKTMTSKYADYSEYPTLKLYYSEVNSYAEFAKSPECSFEQLKTTMEEYEKEIRTYKADLEFIFED